MSSLWSVCRRRTVTNRGGAYLYLHYTCSLAVVFPIVCLLRSRKVPANTCLGHRVPFRRVVGGFSGLIKEDPEKELLVARPSLDRSSEESVELHCQLNT